MVREVKFKNDISTKKNNINPQNLTSSQKQRAKQKIMDKFNLSSDDAEKVLNNLQNKPLKVKSDTKKPDENVDFDVYQNESQMEKINEKQSGDVELDVYQNNVENSSDTMVHESEVNENSNVDDILSDIIPDYNKHVSIEVNNVDLTFEVDSEKVDTIKERVIRILRNEEVDKIRIHALNDISFKIYKGEKVGLIGYNGAGKSTLLHVICGAFAPDSGSIKTHGNISPMLGLGAGFDHNYSGRQNIFFNGAVLGYDKEFLKQKEQEIIDFSGLGEYIDMPIKNYSSGMLSKLGFSIATIVDPDILIIDEVLGVGDVTFAKKSSDKIKSLMDGGTTVLLVSHSIPTIREICDKAIWLDKGKVREIGEVNKVCDHYLKDAEKATNEQLANIQFR